MSRKPKNEVEEKMIRKNIYFSPSMWADIKRVAISKQLNLTASDMVRMYVKSGLERDKENG